MWQRSLSTRRILITLTVAVVATLAGMYQATAQETGVEIDGRWIKYDGEYSYIVGTDRAQRLASWSSVDYEDILDILAADQINYIRIWVEPVFMDPDDDPSYIHPYARSGGDFDLESWNNTYWTRLKGIVAAAEQRDIIVSVAIWNVLVAQFDQFDSPFDTADNLNSVFSAGGDGDLHPQWYDLNYSESGETLREHQEALIAKTINELDPYDNVIFEIQNENGLEASSESQATTWQNAMADYASGLTSKPVMVHAHHGSGSHVDAIEDYWDRSDNDILNFHFYSGNPNQISNLLHDAQVKDKVLFDNEGIAATNLVDPDPDDPECSLNNGGLNNAMKNNWGMLTSGGYGAVFGHSICLPNIGDSVYQAMADRLKAQREIVETLEFQEMSPVDGSGAEFDSLVTAGPAPNDQVLAEVGEQYLVFFWGSKSTTAATVNLPAGDYDYTWYDVRDADVVGSGSISGGGSTNIPAPSTGSWSNNAGLTLTITEG